ncbi:MAG: hypothetical protein IJ538_03560 [Clostridia bacterium]|nr:hypothetical protein [Clostridia bacterium]
MKKIVVVGAYGKMGKIVSQKLCGEFEIIKVGRGDNLFEICDANLIIDFATAESSVLSAKFAVLKKIPLIVGSTGQSHKQMDFIVSCSKEIPVMIQPNFSVGICLMKRAIQTILLQNIDDIAIFERHHKSKKDSPSGTALDLMSLIKKKFFGDVQVLCERGGNEVGTHVIDFYFGDEKISISHVAFSREGFACGARLAVKFLIDKPNGLYNLEEVIKT